MIGIILNCKCVRSLMLLIRFSEHGRSFCMRLLVYRNMEAYIDYIRKERNQ